MHTLVIDAGHYLGTPGRRCLKEYDPNETQEWVLNDGVADKLETILAEYKGVAVYRADDTTGKTDPSLAARANVANNINADFYLSIHHNAGINGGNGGGIVAYVHPDCSNKAKIWQKKIYNKLIEKTGLKGNRATPLAEGNFQVLRDTAMAAVLLELGFMDSSTDIPIIITEEYSMLCAKAIAEVIVTEWNLKKIDEETTLPVPPVIESVEPVIDNVGEDQVVEVDSTSVKVPATVNADAFEILSNIYSELGELLEGWQ